MKKTYEKPSLASALLQRVAAEPAPSGYVPVP